MPTVTSMRKKIEAWASLDAGMEAWEARAFAAAFWCDPTTGTTVFPDCLELGGRPYTSLPGNLRRVEGYLAADRCPNLVSIEGPLFIEGGLDLQGCTSLTSIRGRVEAAAVNLKGCSSLWHVPTGLTTEILDLADCLRLTLLPGGLDLMYLDLTGCSNLGELPEDMKVSEALWLTGCAGLTSLPSNLETCNLFLEGCRSLRSLPDGLRVRDLLSLRDCSSLERLPDGLVVGGETPPPEGFIVLHGCSELERFYCSDRRRIRQLAEMADGFSLAGWQELAFLPEHLEVRGTLDLTGCVNLSELPRGLRVGGNLKLTGCGSLVLLPADILVAGDLYVPARLFTEAVTLEMSGRVKGTVFSDGAYP